LQNKFRMQPELYIEKLYKFSDDTYELIAENGKIYVPKFLQDKCAKWCYLTLMHPDESQLELTVGQHYTWIALTTTCEHVYKTFQNCVASKKRDKKCCMLPPKPTPEIIPWHMLCMDLVDLCCWKMCASTTMVSLKNPLQDPLQHVASSNTAIISNKLICCHNRIDLFIQHLLEIIPSDRAQLGRDKIACGELLLDYNGIDMTRRLGV